MVKHNNAIAKIHLRKHWINRVKTHFDQPAKKSVRRQQRDKKAAAMFPRPINSLRPIVSSATRKHAGKVRLGRGFTLAELKDAKLSAKFARTVGISVDHRRTSTSMEQREANVRRLSEYKNKLILFPRRESKPKKGEIADSTAEQLKNATQVLGTVKPLSKPVQVVEYAAITEEDKKSRVYHALRTIRTNTRYKGRRDKKAKDEEDAKK